MIKNELELFFCTRSTIVLSAAAGLLAFIAGMNGAGRAVRQQNAADSAQKIARAAFDEAAQKIAAPKAAGAAPESAFADPTQPAVFGNGKALLTLPPRPLFETAVGMSELHPQIYSIGLRGRWTLRNSQHLESTVHLAAGAFDLAFVIVWIAPLLVLALCFDLVSSEKESGTLLLLASVSRHPQKIFALRAMLRALSIALAIAAGAFAALRDVNADWLSWWSILLSWCVFWAALSLAISGRARSSASAGVALASAWIFIVVLLPSLVNSALKTFAPLPSRVELIGKLRDASKAASEQGENLLRRYYTDHPELAGAVEGEAFFAKRVVVRKNMEAELGPILDRFDEEQQKRIVWIDRLKWLLPSVALQDALLVLAGTDLRRQLELLEQAERAQKEWERFFDPLTVTGKRLKLEDLERVPKLGFHEPALSSADALSAPAFLLAIACILFFLHLRSAHRFVL